MDTVGLVNEVLETLEEDDHFIVETESKRNEYDSNLFVMHRIDNGNGGFCAWPVRVYEDIHVGVDDLSYDVCLPFQIDEVVNIEKFMV